MSAGLELPTTAVIPAGFAERRASIRNGSAPPRERRQFASNYDSLTAEGRELATAIDGYKLNHRRRYITYDEMVCVLKSLGYSKT